MVVGEDKSKVSNIVRPNMDHFRELYSSVLQQHPQVVYKMQQGRLEVSAAGEPSAGARSLHLPPLGSPETQDSGGRRVCGLKPLIRSFCRREGPGLASEHR